MKDKQLNLYCSQCVLYLEVPLYTTPPNVCVHKERKLASSDNLKKNEIMC